MKKRLLTLLCLVVTGFTLQAQSTALYSENFNGASHTFSLNTADVMSTTNGANDWVVNNAYTGGAGTVICLGFPFSLTIANTPNQPGGINGNPNSNYLHILADDGVSNGIFNANYRPADGLCVFPENYFASMTNDISTTGNINVELSFYWICGGAVGTTYGEVYYSTNSGTSWTLLTSPVSQYLNQPTWTQQTITDPAFENQSTLRFGFRFVSLTASTGAEPSFSIDEVVITGQTGCASTTGSATAGICQGDSILLGGVFQTTAGNYVDTLVNAGGCDSILTTALTVSQTSTNNANAAICQGDSILLGGTFQNTAGVYTDLFQNAFGCDSIVVTTLAISPSSSMNATASICDGDSILLAGAFQTTAGAYTDVFTNAFGCDSILITTLSIAPSYNENASASICTGDSILLGGTFQTTAGTYTDLFTTADGCDSLVVTTLSVSNPDTSVSLTGQTISSGSSTATYQWIDCSLNTAISGETSQDYTPTVSGEYAVVVTENGCSDTSSCIFVFVVGIEEGELARNVRYFPNPVEDLLKVDLGKWYRGIQIHVYDAAGRQVMSQSSGNGANFSLDMGDLAKGIYVIRVQAGDDIAALRIIKE